MVANRYFQLLRCVELSEMVRRVGVVGYGHLGQFLVEQVRLEPGLQLAWVWNRSGVTDPSIGSVSNTTFTSIHIK